MITFYVRLDPMAAALKMQSALIENSITGTLTDMHRIDLGEGRCVVVQVFEKHFYRVGELLTLTAAIDNAQGATRVHLVSAGGGSTFFHIDWGASNRFEQEACEALAEYRVNGKTP